MLIKKIPYFSGLVPTLLQGLAKLRQNIRYEWFRDYCCSPNKIWGN